MNLVLALEPDASQAATLTALVRRKLGANLTIVPTTQAAIVAINQRLPDVLVFGRDVPPAEREQAVAHLASLSGGTAVRTLEIAKLSDPGAHERLRTTSGCALQRLKKERVRAMATLIGSAHDDSEVAGLNMFLSESAEPRVQKASTPNHSHQPHIQAEIDRRVSSEVERLQREADGRVTTELQQDATPPSLQQETTEPRVWLRSANTARWRAAAIAALIVLVIGAGVLSLPNAVSSAARKSTALVDSAQNAAKAAAKQAVTVAPEVTRNALSAAGRVLPQVEIVTVPIPAPAPSPAPAEKPTALTGPGFLTAFSRIPMEVYADGKRLGSSEDGQLLIASGTHQIEFVSERFRYRAIASLTIPPGHVLPYTVALPSAEVYVTTTPGAEVWIEGERVGVAPLDAIMRPYRDAGDCGEGARWCGKTSGGRGEAG